MKKRIERKVPEYDNISSDLEGSIEQVISNLIRLKEQYKNCVNLRINTEYNYGSTVFILAYDAEENDTEYQQRLLKEQQQKDHRKAEYERLKKEFEQ